VTTAFGKDPAIRFPGTTVIAFPLTMISKRIEDGESIDVSELFSRVSERLRAPAHQRDFREIGVVQRWWIQYDDFMAQASGAKPHLSYAAFQAARTRLVDDFPACGVDEKALRDEFERVSPSCIDRK
jgi:hypothetical protein